MSNAGRRFKSWNHALGLAPMPTLDTYKTPRLETLRATRKIYVELILGVAHIFDVTEDMNRGKRVGYALVSWDGKMVIAEVWVAEHDRSVSEFEAALAAKYGRIYAMEMSNGN